ncbi:MAG: hypothetical protein ABSH29_24740 [Acidimicrobiales bacterium]
MATRGPVPKPSSQRRRRNKESAPTTAPTAPVAPPAPEPDPDWHPIASAWFCSLGESGQAQFYEPSDYATARYVAEAMTRNLASSRLSGQLFAAVMSAMTELLTTEGSRRRARVMAEYRNASRPPKG